MLAVVVHNDLHIVVALCIDSPIQVLFFLACAFKAAVKIRQGQISILGIFKAAI